MSTPGKTIQEAVDAQRRQRDAAAQVSSELAAKREADRAQADQAPTS